MVVFASVLKVPSIVELAQEAGFYYKTTGVWHKTNPMPRNMNIHFIQSTEMWCYFINQKKRGTFNNEGCAIHDFFECPVPVGKERDRCHHPTQKPTKMLDHLIRILSNEGDTVLDPFMGSGSTGAAALAAGRKFIGIEKNEEYFQKAKRWIEEVADGG